MVLWCATLVLLLAPRAARAVPPLPVHAPVGLVEAGSTGSGWACAGRLVHVVWRRTVRQARGMGRAVWCGVCRQVCTAGSTCSSNFEGAPSLFEVGSCRVAHPPAHPVTIKTRDKRRVTAWQKFDQRGAQALTTRCWDSSGSSKHNLLPPSLSPSPASYCLPLSLFRSCGDTALAQF